LVFAKNRAAEAQRSVVAIFFLQGFLMVTQIPRIPEIIKQVGVDFTTWGLILGFAGLGGLVGLLMTSRFISKYGTKNVSIVGSVGMVLSIAAVGFVDNGPAFFAVSAAYAFLASIFNISLNSQTVALQKAMNRVIIGKFHASWAIGAATSSAVSGFFSTFMPLWIHLLLVTGVCGALILYFAQTMLSNAEDGHGQGKSAKKPVSFFKSPPTVWLLAAGLFTGVMCEVTLMDWSAVFSQEALGLAAGKAAIPYTAFSAALIIGRLMINPLSKRWHLSKITQFAGIGGSISMLCAIVFGVPLAETNPDLAIVVVSIFFALTGFGAAPMVPSFFSLAGSVKGLNTAEVMARMSLVNSVAIMIVKIMMGSTADTFGVAATFAYGVVAMFAGGIISGVLASHAKRKPKESAYPATGAMFVVEE
jgi:predicted MFS family arabinose efflux permease